MQVRSPARFAVVAAAIALAAFALQGATRTPLPVPRKAVPPFAVAGVRRVVVVVLENGDAQDAARQPFMKFLAETGMMLNSYYAVAHPSQPNYVALISGSTEGAMTDGNIRLPSTRKHLGNILPAGSWRVYAEDYPALPDRCNLVKQGSGPDRLYVRRHVPFLSFADVQDGKCTELVRLNTATDAVGALRADIESQHMPLFSMIVPNLEHDGHEPSNLKKASEWLTANLEPLLLDRKFVDGLVFILLFDEDDSRSSGRNRVYTAIWGDRVKNGASDDVYDHEDLLATICALLRITPPPFDEPGVRPIGGIWK
jgi:Phosphoesterase family